MDKEDILTKEFGRYKTAFCLSKALLEDYANVVSKLEQVPAEEVTERINKRTREIFNQLKAEAFEGQ